jgi:hypothetical protein
MGPLVIFSLAGLNGERGRSCWVYVRWASQFLETFFDNVAETAAKTAFKNWRAGDNPLYCEENRWDG